MKKFLPFLLILFCCSCHNTDINNLQLQIDSLKTQINSAYKPGLGEFMSGIQLHHEKLWFAGNAGNWRLADFEIHEMIEAVDDIKNYAADRPETKDIDMLQPAIDSIKKSIKEKSVASFKSGFIFLTNTCNKCHAAVDYNFNQIKIPDTPPFSNQVFKIDSVK